MQVVLVEIDAVPIAGGAGVTFYLSDVGYVSLASDPGGPVCYLPFLDQPLQCDRELPVSPESARMVGASWGDITVMNQRLADGTGYWDAIVPAYAVAGRGVRVKVGLKTWDDARGLWVDPSISSFQPVFSGIALDWVTSADGVNIRIRDNLAPLEGPLQTSFYGGAGGADGNAQIAGQPVPKLRGIVKNVTPTFVDPTNLVYQVNDTQISSVAVYDGGLALTAGSNYATYTALVAATVTSGTFATSLVNGLIRLGAAPTFDVTVDASGYSLDGTLHTDPASIAQALIQNDAGYSGAVDTIGYAAMAANNPYDAGFYSGPNQMSAIDFLTPLLASIQASIGTDISGKVTIFQLSPPETYAGSSFFNYTAAHILDCQPVDLDQSVISPNWRRTFSYAPNDTLQTTLAGAISNARRQFLTNPYSKVFWSAAGNKTKWLTALDAPLVAGRLRTKADAQGIVNAMGALWGKQRYLYDISLPLPVPLALPLPLAADLGQFGTITYPDGPLSVGADVFVVGFNIDLKANTIVLRVFL